MHSEPVPLNDAQREVLERLGAPRSERPTFEPGLREHLRLGLERRLAEAIRAIDRPPDDPDCRGDVDEPDVADPGAEPADVVWLSKHALEKIHGCELRFIAERDRPFAWSPAVARGIVAHRAIEIEITSPRQWAPLDLVDEAIARLISEGRSIGEWLAAASEAEIDAVRAEANNAVVAYQECFPRLERRWRPATEVPMRAEFLAGRVVLSGKPDLTIGRADGQVAGKVIVDFKTGSRKATHVDDLRFYALLDALKVGVPPRLLVSYYLDSGTMTAETVTEDLLDATVLRVADAAAKILELLHELREPRVVPSTSCRWCPLLTECPTGRAFLSESDEDLDIPWGD